MALDIRQSVPLGPLTTFALGGPAHFFTDITEPSQVGAALAFANQQRLPAFVMGGGANLVVSDEGFAGLVLHMRTRGQRWTDAGGEIRVEVAAGETWDDVVAEAVRRQAAGIECLAGIPGSTGAAPVQNIGAYGQEVAGAIRRLRVLERDGLRPRELDPDDCAFAYRDSLFKREPERFVILSVTLGLAKHGSPSLRYAELAAALAAGASLAEVRETVLRLRGGKSMLLDDADPNRRSAGSFFTNPIVTAGFAAELAARATATGAARSPDDVPRFPLPDGRVKLAAGWLVERSGLAKGFRLGSVGISSRHALALVHHGGGTTQDLLRLALHVRAKVRERFGVVLVPEPVFLGLSWPD